MGYSKTILCLANSRKQSGRCIAGREITDGKPGDWIRPVSGRDTEEISEEERRFKDGDTPSVLDIIRIPMLEPRPKSYQSENHLIDDQFYWEKVRRASWQEAAAAVDPVQGNLWENGHHDRNDRIPEDRAGQLPNSLLLVRPENAVIRPVQALHKKQVRASFGLNGQDYDLVVTDPEIERYVLKMTDNDEYPVPRALLCVSLGEIFEGHAWKLIASVITEKRARQVQ